MDMLERFDELAEMLVSASWDVIDDFMDGDGMPDGVREALVNEVERRLRPQAVGGAE